MNKHKLKVTFCTFVNSCLGVSCTNKHSTISVWVWKLLVSRRPYFNESFLQTFFSYGSGLHQTTSHPVFIQKRMKCAAAAHTSSNFCFLQLCSTDPVTPFMPLACPIILGTGGKIWHMDYPKAHNSALSKSTSAQYCKAADFIILELGHSLYIVELLEISTIFTHVNVKAYQLNSTTSISTTDNKIQEIWKTITH